MDKQTINPTSLSKLGIKFWCGNSRHDEIREVIGVVLLVNEMLISDRWFKIFGVLGTSNFTISNSELPRRNLRIDTN